MACLMFHYSLIGLFLYDINIQYQKNRVNEEGRSIICSSKNCCRSSTVNTELSN